MSKLTYRWAAYDATTGERMFYNECEGGWTTVQRRRKKLIRDTQRKLVLGRQRRKK